MMRELNGKEVEYADAIHSNIITKFSLLDRVRILFGSPVMIEVVVYTKEVVSVVGSESKPFIPLLFPRKKKTGMIHDIAND